MSCTVVEETNDHSALKSKKCNSDSHNVTDGDGTGGTLNVAADKADDPLNIAADKADGTLNIAVEKADGTLKGAADKADDPLNVAVEKADGTLKGAADKADGTLNVAVDKADDPLNVAVDDKVVPTAARGGEKVTKEYRSADYRKVRSGNRRKRGGNIQQSERRPLIKSAPKDDGDIKCEECCLCLCGCLQCILECGRLLVCLACINECFN